MQRWKKGSGDVKLTYSGNVNTHKRGKRKQALLERYRVFYVCWVRPHTVAEEERSHSPHASNSIYRSTPHRVNIPAKEEEEEPTQELL